MSVGEREGVRRGAGGRGESPVGRLIARMPAGRAALLERGAGRQAGRERAAGRGGGDE